MIDHIYSDWEEFHVTRESEDNQQHGCDLCKVFKYQSAGGIYRGTDTSMSGLNVTDLS